MGGLLLYVNSDNTLLFYLLWIGGFLAMVLLIALIFRQRSVGIRLRTELTELDKARRSNVESEFVLKAMKLCTWHIDIKKRLLTCENDYREGSDNVLFPPDMPVEQFLEFLSKTDTERFKAALEDVFMGRRDFFFQQYRIHASPSAPYYWEESYAIVSDRDVEGQPVRLVGTTMRIDERKQLEAALISARNKAEESDRLKTAFLANMGHEIRTPLNAIVGFADLLPIVQSDEDRQQLIKEIQANNRKLLDIIDGLVSMSKIESEARNLVKSQTDLPPLLQQIADAHATTVDPSAVIVATQFPYSSLMITTDVGKLSELVNHLMQNAVKFTNKGSITLGYEIVGGDHVRIWIRDTGKGIAEADQQRVFDRFVKLDEYIPGTGLGLSVVMSHAKSLGGTVGLKSKLGEGSLFWVDLPMT